ncbi:MAG: hypothetical protein RI857_00215 [Planktomarina sp.]|nr:hypothetical protein [Planktomarina sp.]MDS9932238.1 hypothetical protein [Planktomarina sp.]
MTPLSKFDRSKSFSTGRRKRRALVSNVETFSGVALGADIGDCKI